jgi:hypothetical protein
MLEVHLQGGTFRFRGSDAQSGRGKGKQRAGGPRRQTRDGPTPILHHSVPPLAASGLKTTKTNGPQPSTKHTGGSTKQAARACSCPRVSEDWALCGLLRFCERC